MKLKLPPIPKDSSLQHFVNIMKVTEAPLSYAYVVGLSLIGCVLKRKVYIDQLRWQVYPTIRVLLIGPSGIGKDRTLDEAEEILSNIKHGIPKVGGRTIENMIREALMIEPPCIAYVPIPELTSFLGKKDYQAGAMERLTDLLSDKRKVNVSIKSDKEPVFLMYPTLTIHAASTKEWLQKNTPEGALEGGFFPRFVIVVEEYTGKFKPLIKRSTDKRDKEAVKVGFKSFTDLLDQSVEKFSTKTEIHLTEEASQKYENWYINRHSYFAPSVRPYAERSRDNVLRFAMNMALSRGRSWVDDSDVQWGIDLMHYLAVGIENAMLPSTVESRCSQEIVKLLPTSKAEILINLNKTYAKRTIMDSLGLLVECNRVIKEGNEYKVNDELGTIS